MRGGDRADSFYMTINFRSKRRTSAECEHESQMRTEIAGMSREVCESCGRVSVGFVAHHFASQGNDTRAQRPEEIVRVD